MARRKKNALYMLHDDLELLEMALYKPGEGGELADLVVAVYHYSAFGEHPNLEGRSEHFSWLYNRMISRLQ